MSTVATVKTNGYIVRLDRFEAESGYVVVERPENATEDHAIKTTKVMPLDDAEKLFWGVSKFIFKYTPDIEAIAVRLGHATVEKL